MNNSKPEIEKGNPHVVILGAGPAGLGAASQLVKKRGLRVSVLEQNSYVGGNAGSFNLEGIYVDYGSHRLHPTCDPEVLSDIKSMLGEDLLDKPRHGRIRMRERWLHFPLKALDLTLNLPPAFTFGVIRDQINKTLRGLESNNKEETFASVMEKGLGSTICRDFYFPYARKIWGLEPNELSPTQARRRVSGDSISKMIGKVFKVLPGVKRQGAGRFYYPRNGYGQISEAYFNAAKQGGAQIYLESRVNSVQVDEQNGRFKIQFTNRKEGGVSTLEADHLWSTIPITILTRILKPEVSSDLIEAARKINYRAMILIYLVLEQERFSEFDAHYFPEEDVKITRLSEPKIYSNAKDPTNRTVICAELPCSRDDAEWGYDQSELVDLLKGSLKTCGIAVKAPIQNVHVRRLKQAYPIYRLGYEAQFDQLDRWISQIKNMVSFGRQGLFAHDNTHHALFMAYSAAKCLDARGIFDQERWNGYRRVFETHVVED